MTLKTLLLGALLLASSAFALTDAPTAETASDHVGLQCADMPCAKVEAYEASILRENARLGASLRYLLIGDSITESARLSPICGARPINAGIGGTTTITWLDRARPLVDQIRPDFIVVALGTNDGWQKRIEGYGDRLDTLIERLRPYPIIIVPPPPSPDPKLAADFAAITAIAATRPNAAQPLPAVTTVDGVHLTDADYVAWRAAIAAKAAAVACPALATRNFAAGHHDHDR